MWKVIPSWSFVSFVVYALARSRPWQGIWGLCPSAIAQTIAPDPATAARKSRYRSPKVWYRACLLFRWSQKQVTGTQGHSRTLILDSSRSEAISMKITLCVLGILCFAGVAFGQAGSAIGSGISAEPVVYEFRSHEGHATQQSMGQQQNIMEQSMNVQAHGVRPLWEVATPAYVTPLGDSARLLRQEHMSAKKADIVWNN
jgi:hypothetical protein